MCFHGDVGTFETEYQKSLTVAASGTDVCLHPGFSSNNAETYTSHTLADQQKNKSQTVLIIV